MGPTRGREAGQVPKHSVMCAHHESLSKQCRGAVVAVAGGGDGGDGHVPAAVVVAAVVAAMQRAATPMAKALIKQINQAGIAEVVSPPLELRAWRK